MKIIAHRGASGHEPENTRLAIELALDMQVDAIEVDVHLIENELIVIHDRWLHKSTNGEGRISEKTFEQLRQLDAGKGQKIPTLWEVLQLVEGRCDLNIELKSENTVLPVLHLLSNAMIQLSFRQSQFLISSFNHHLLQEIKSQSFAWKTGALIASRPLRYAEFAEELGAYSIHIDVEFVNESFVVDAHSRGIKVFVYTVDFEEDIEDMLRLNVDGVFTNYPTRSMVKIAHFKA